jgi:energy-coupling factor transporter ATP-binding protein EcfA2
MLRLRRLKINKFRAVKPGTELFFNDGFNVVLGRNATGKTTLLELISMALRFDFSSIRDEDFDVEVEVLEILEGTSNSVVMQVGTRLDDSGMAVSMPGQRQRIPWVKATIRVDSDTYRYHEDGQEWGLLQNETSAGAGRSFGEWGSSLLRLACMTIVGVPDAELPVTVPIWGSVERGSWHAIRHDESLDSFNKCIITELKIPIDFILSEGKTNTFERISPWIKFLFFAPASLAERVRRRFQDTPNAAVLTFSHDDLPFLGEFVRLCGFESAGLELSLLGINHLGPGSDTAIATFGEPRFLFTRKGGRSTIRHELLSFGQKRLLSLLYYLEASPGHLVADEMVNGLHHAWIEVLMEKIGDRQTFLSSQNPLLLDYMEFESAEKVSRSFVLCELDELDELVWRNMSAEEASSFYSAYEVGIQHVGEILRTKGLW